MADIKILDSAPLLTFGEMLPKIPTALDTLLSRDSTTYVTQTVYDDVARDLRFETDRTINGWLVETMASRQVKRIDTPQRAGTDDARRDSILWALENRFNLRRAGD